MNKSYIIVLSIIFLESLLVVLFSSDELPDYVFIIMYALFAYSIKLIIREKGLHAGHITMEIMGLVFVTMLAFVIKKEKLGFKEILGLITAMLTLYLLD